MRHLHVLIFAVMSLIACTYTVKVEPIHLTVDVNIKIDRALDDFFAQPATTPAVTPEPTPAK